MDKKQEKIDQKIRKDEAKRQEKVEKEEKDADKIEEEVKASVDEETLVDLYGEDSKSFSSFFFFFSSRAEVEPFPVFVLSQLKTSNPT